MKNREREMRRKLQLMGRPLGLAITLALANSAMAQDSNTEAAAESHMLEEVTVTAQKRAESLQDVPISILAMSGENIEEMSLTNAADVTANMPAITVVENPIGNFIFMRGIGTPGANQGMEQSVSIFHDGIYMGRHQLSRAPFMDLERVEVLRGPQSVLFGKNTIGGAIHVISAKPTDEFEASLSGLYGWEEGETEITGVLSGPITDRLRGRIAVRSFEMDGYLDNVMTHEEGPSRDDRTLRAQLAWDATDELTITAKWETSEFETGEKTTQMKITNPFTPGAAAFSGLNRALVAAATGGDGILRWDEERAVDNDGGVLLGQVVPVFAGLPGFPDLAELSDNEMDVGTLTIDWALGENTLTAITGFAQYEGRLRSVQPGNPADFPAGQYLRLDCRVLLPGKRSGVPVRGVFRYGDGIRVARCADTTSGTEPDAGLRNGPGAGHVGPVRFHHLEFHGYDPAYGRTAVLRGRQDRGSLSEQAIHRRLGLQCTGRLARWNDCLRRYGGGLRCISRRLRLGGPGWRNHPGIPHGGSLRRLSGHLRA